MADKFGEIINSKRTTKGWTQEQLAEELFVTRQTVSRWERGHSYPTIDTLVKLSQILDFSLDYALLGDEEMVDKVSKDQKNALRNKRLLSVVIAFLVLMVFWGIVNLLQLNYRDVPPGRVLNAEIVGNKVVVTIDDSGFWSSRSAMLDLQEDEDAVLEVNQQFRFLNILKDGTQVFVLTDDTGLLEDTNFFTLKGSAKKIPVSREP